MTDETTNIEFLEQRRKSARRKVRYYYAGGAVVALGGIVEATCMPGNNILVRVALGIGSVAAGITIANRGLDKLHAESQKLIEAYENKVTLSEAELVVLNEQNRLLGEGQHYRDDKSSNN